MHRLKFGRGAIYKGRYTPVFCIELACWLLEASWQAYYSTQFSVINGEISDALQVELLSSNSSQVSPVE